MIAFTSDQWVILALVFTLGLLVGAFLFAGSGRKWKRRYREAEDQRAQWERSYNERDAELTAREKEWREQDSLRQAAIKDRRDAETDRPL